MPRHSACLRGVCTMLHPTFTIHIGACLLCTGSRDPGDILKIDDDIVFLVGFRNTPSLTINVMLFFATGLSATNKREGYSHFLMKSYGLK